MSKKQAPYELDDIDLELVEKCRAAIEYERNGDPVKDVMDESDLIDSVHLLIAIIDAGGAA